MFTLVAEFSLFVDAIANVLLLHDVEQSSNLGANSVDRVSEEDNDAYSSKVCELLKRARIAEGSIVI